LTFEDELRSGRPLEATDEEHVKALEKLFGRKLFLINI
jgi:hypothetical protein